jgi:hypothetical protein
MSAPFPCLCSTTAMHHFTNHSSCCFLTSAANYSCKLPGPRALGWLSSHSRSTDVMCASTRSKVCGGFLSSCCLSTENMIIWDDGGSCELTLFLAQSVPIGKVVSRKREELLSSNCVRGSRYCFPRVGVWPLPLWVSVLLHWVRSNWKRTWLKVTAWF